MDLVVLVADADMEAAVTGLLTERHQAMGIREISFRCQRHPQRDAGCRRQADAWLRPQASQYRRCLVMFDREGSGAEAQPREQIEAEVEDALSRSGWEGRCAAIVLDPELEVWGGWFPVHG